MEKQYTKPILSRLSQSHLIVWVPLPRATAADRVNAYYWSPGGYYTNWANTTGKFIIANAFRTTREEATKKQWTCEVCGWRVKKHMNWGSDFLPHVLNKHGDRIPETLPAAGSTIYVSPDGFNTEPVKPKAAFNPVTGGPVLQRKNSIIIRPVIQEICQ